MRVFFKIFFSLGCLSVFLQFPHIYSEETSSGNPVMRWIFGPTINDYYLVREKDPEKARQILIQLLNNHSDSALLNKEMAYFLLAHKEYEESLPYLKKAQEINPSDEKITLQLGYVLDLLNRKKEALVEFKKLESSENQEIRKSAAQAIVNLTQDVPQKVRPIVREENPPVPLTPLQKYYDLRKKILS